MITLRPRTDEDNDFIESVTREELVPVLEQAWRFAWDGGHARKFMLDLLTVGETMIVKDGEKPVGYVWYVVQPRRRWLLSRPVFWINYLVISGEFQRRGIGARVIDECAGRARAAGCRTMELWVQVVNEGARKFYEGAGFTSLARDGDNIPMRRRV